MALALLVVAPHGRLAAQPSPEPSDPQLKLARSLYYDGLELLDKAEWAQAADRLQRVLEIRNSAVVSFHLASALTHLQRYVDARLLLQRVLNDAKASADIRAAADQLLPTVERDMGRLTLRLRGDLEGVQVLIDGRETPSAVLDVPVPVDPHDVSVVATRDGEQVAATSALVGGAAGLHVEVVLDIPQRSAVVAAAPTPAPAAVIVRAPVIAPNLALTSAPERKPAAPLPLERAAAADGDGGSGLLTQWWFWTAIGVVTAGAVIATVALSSGTEPADLSRVRGDFEPGLLEGTVR